MNKTTYDCIFISVVGRVDECVQGRNVGLPGRYRIGLQTKHSSILKELFWNNLAHYYRLALRVRKFSD